MKTITIEENLKILHYMIFTLRQGQPFSFYPNRLLTTKRKNPFLHSQRFNQTQMQIRQNLLPLDIGEKPHNILMTRDKNWINPAGCTSLWPAPDAKITYGRWEVTAMNEWTLNTYLSEIRDTFDTYPNAFKTALASDEETLRKDPIVSALTEIEKTGESRCLPFIGETFFKGGSFFYDQTAPGKTGGYDTTDMILSNVPLQPL